MSIKEAKLIFSAKIDSLKHIQCNTIAQINTEFSYIKRWGEIYSVDTDDKTNVSGFFMSINKLSSVNFRPAKIKEFWLQYNMEDITDYVLIISGESNELLPE